VAVAFSMAWSEAGVEGRAVEDRALGLLAAFRSSWNSANSRRSTGRGAPRLIQTEPVVSETETLKPFRDWAVANGYRKGLSIDRINNNGPSSPDNCRWATAKEQNRNTRQNRIVTAWGETKTMVEWSEDKEV
jgi:hypothetical protein